MPSAVTPPQPIARDGCYRAGSGGKPARRLCRSAPPQPINRINCGRRRGEKGCCCRLSVVLIGRRCRFGRADGDGCRGRKGGGEWPIFFFFCLVGGRRRCLVTKTVPAAFGDEDGGDGVWWRGRRRRRRLVARTTTAAEGGVRRSGASASSAAEGLVGVDGGGFELCRRVAAVAEGHSGHLVRAQGRRLRQAVRRWGR
ncbi:evolutionarily conserved C-terminal region 10 [Striga asiatica]|uniref:Evolutionarily conserved C-terminal region 10 n=1 Tax=Striga asiatica TaxID=4170 RepID=A0A5A7PF47_STRAF|nr:evolutionarily conserved C-terminal region 10 [Striga asiatica]